MIYHQDQEGHRIFDQGRAFGRLLPRSDFVSVCSSVACLDRSSCRARRHHKDPVEAGGFGRALIGKVTSFSGVQEKGVGLYLGVRTGAGLHGGHFH